MFCLKNIAQLSINKTSQKKDSHVNDTHFHSDPPSTFTDIGSYGNLLLFSFYLLLFAVILQAQNKTYVW